MPDYVRVTNLDDKPFQYHMDNVKKRIPPGKDMMMPWGLACTLFGDPFLTDQPKKPDRTDALRRARGNFNYELGMESMDTFMSRVPKLKIHDMETGQEIHMLLWDPEGEHRDDFVSPDVDASDTVTMLSNQLALVQAQLQQILAAQQQYSPELMGQTQVVSTDAPAQAADMPKVTEWVGGNPFAQREDDANAEPLWDFAAIAAAPVDGSAGPVPDGMAVDADNGAPEDTPQDAGVGSGRGKSKLAPKP